MQNCKTADFLQADMVDKAGLPEKLGGGLPKAAFTADAVALYRTYLNSKETFRL